MRIGESKTGEALVLAPEGRADSASAAVLEAALNAASERREAKVVVDFSAVDYISSAGLRALLAGAKRLQVNGGGVALCGINSNVREVFEVSGFLAVFPSREGRAAAAQVLNASADGARSGGDGGTRSGGEA